MRYWPLEIHFLAREEYIMMIMIMIIIMIMMGQAELSEPPSIEDFLTPIFAGLLVSFQVLAGLDPLLWWGAHSLWKNPHSHRLTWAERKSTILRITLQIQSMAFFCQTAEGQGKLRSQI